jgi:serine/threonine protein phosphatase PrpC
MSLSNSLQMVKATHTGMVRSHNEDSITTDVEIGLAVLADGMGGYNAGEVASGITSIYQSANSQPQYAGMGTTLVVTLMCDNKITVAHIGDSRCYRFREGKLEQVTRDHSLLQEQIDSGLLTKEAARRSQNKNLVTRALGIEPQVEAEIHTYPAQNEDVFLLCSDGLNDMVEDEDIEMTLAALAANLQLAAEQLVQMANDNGGRDNVSVILIKVRKDFPAEAGWVTKFLGWFK